MPCHSPPTGACSHVDENALEKSPDRACVLFSPHTQWYNNCGDPVLNTSTPDLSLAASSSPYWSPMRGLPSQLPTSSFNLGGGNEATLYKPAHRACFVRHLDHLLRRVAEQQYHAENNENIRIQSASSEQSPGSELQTAFIACDTLSESPVDPINQCSHHRSSLPLDLQRCPSLDYNTSSGYLPAAVSHVASDDSRLSKRKTSATTESFEPNAKCLKCDGPFVRQSDFYLSASDSASPSSSRDLQTHCPPFKKQKCLYFEGTPSSVVSPCAESPALSKTNPFPSASSSIPRLQDFSSNTAVETSAEGKQDTQFTALSNFSSSRPDSSITLVPSYPPTQPATRVPSPTPIPALWRFHEADIPRVYASSDDAAEARLRVMLRKEALYVQRGSTGALAALELAPQESFVVEVITWILTVEPPSSSPTASLTKKGVHSQDLNEQLTLHHESRFFAAYLFTSFFFSVPASGEGLEEADVAGASHKEEPKDCQKMVVWDYAIAAIALAVKIHRDYLPPLKPIYARHFLALAPHEMYFDDLELAQRDLLEYFSYDLGMPTPQGLLDELHLALPTLRYALDFENAWEDVLSETWTQLLAAARSPDMLRFPVSLLTATALIEAITRVVCRYLTLMKLRVRAGCLSCACDCHMKHSANSTAKMRLLEDKPTDAELHILHAAGSVLDDIHAVLGLSVKKTKECEEWLALVRSASRRPLQSKYFPAPALSSTSEASGQIDL